MGCLHEAWLCGEVISVLDILCLRWKVRLAVRNMRKELMRKIRVTDRDLEK